MSEYTLKFETLDQVRTLLSLTGKEVAEALKAYNTCRELGIPDNAAAMFAARADIREIVTINMNIGEVFKVMHRDIGCGDKKCNSVSFTKTHTRLRRKCMQLLDQLKNTDDTCGEPIEGPLVAFLGFDFDTAPESAALGGYL